MDLERGEDIFYLSEGKVKWKNYSTSYNTTDYSHKLCHKTPERTVYSKGIFPSQICRNHLLPDCQAQQLLREKCAISASLVGVAELSPCEPATLEGWT